MRKLTHEEIVSNQGFRGEPRIPVAAVLNNIRSAYNVGSIFRTADGAGVQKVYCCGITGDPTLKQIAKTALGAHKDVAWEHHWNIVDVLKKLKADGYYIVLLEQTTKSVPYQSFIPPGPTALIVGHEVEGVSEEVLQYCDAAIDIDMAGKKNSLNVAVAFGIAVYHLRRYLVNREVER